MVKQLNSNNYQTFVYYGPDNNRWRSMNSDNVYYFDNYEEVTINNVKRSFIYLENGVLAVSDNTNGTQFYYMATDVLGSVMGIIDGSGNEVFAASYDPWGKQTITRNDFGFRRGFTGHEMLPHYDLINMNGRLYDPYLARFLSPDNYVQMPDFSQSFNRYSYCLNNPLKYTDPSGELFGIDDAIVGFTLIYGALSGAAMAGMDGGNEWVGAAKGFATSALSLIGTAGIGAAFGHTVRGLGHELLRATAHGLNNGLISVINGNGFGSGFITGAAASLAGSGTQALKCGNIGVAISAIGAGAISSQVSGGNWLDGAMTGLSIGTLNHLGVPEDDVITIERSVPEILVTPKYSGLFFEPLMIEKPLELVHIEFDILSVGRGIWNMAKLFASASKGVIRRQEIRSWLNSANEMEPVKLRKDLESVGFKRASQYSEHYKRGNVTIRLDGADKNTPYNHMHIQLGKKKIMTVYDKNLNIVKPTSPDAHIPIK